MIHSAITLTFILVIFIFDHPHVGGVFATGTSLAIEIYNNIFQKLSAPDGGALIECDLTKCAGGPPIIDAFPFRFAYSSDSIHTENTGSGAVTLKGLSNAIISNNIFEDNTGTTGL